MKVLKSLLGGASFLFISTVLVNAGNYALNLILGRFLGPEDFAEANILATMVLVLSFLALGFQLTIAKFTAEAKAENNLPKLESFFSWMQNKGILFSIALTAVLLLSVGMISSFLNMQSIYPLLITFIGIPLYIYVCLSRGFFQGTSSFKKLAWTYILEMLGRLVVTAILVFVVLQQNLPYASEAVALGFLASFICAFIVSRVKTNNVEEKNPGFDIGLVKKFIVVIALYEFSQILINNSDVLLVKHFFENEEAGLYASLALIGRVVFFATWTIVTLLFPTVIEKEKKGEKHSHLFWISLSVVAFAGMTITTGCYFFDEWIIQILFGGEYLSVSHLLWSYALATSLFACANVFVYYHMSLESYFPVAISLLVGFAQIIFISIFNNSIAMVVQVQIILMMCMIITLAIYHMVSQLKPKETSLNKKKYNYHVEFEQ